MQLTTPTPASTLTPQQMAQNFQQMKGTVPKSASPTTSWDAFDSAMGNKATPIKTPSSSTGINLNGSFTPTSTALGSTLKTDTVNTIKNIGSDISSNNSMAGDIATNGGTTKPTLGTSIVPAILGGAKSVTDIGGEVAKGALKGVGDIIGSFIPQNVKDTYAQATQQLVSDLNSAYNASASNPQEQQGKDQVHAVLNSIVQSAQNNPETAKTIGNAVAMVLAPSAIEGGIGAAEKAADIVSSGADMLGTGINSATNAASDAASSLKEPASSAVKGAVTSIKNAVGGTSESDLQTIKRMISPKPTAKEAKLALDQGRLVKGQEPTLFKSGTPDQITTSDQQLKSSMTIDRLIPDAAKMDEPTLHAALDQKIADTAKALEPKMKATPINEPTVEKITNEWNALKKSEIINADASDEANVLKSQKQFEARLQKSKSGNMNDLWNTAKEYDASIPDNVKSANSMSSESLQNKKTLWLDRRAILRDAINDASNGLGKTSQQGFSDMRDMYEAQNGIMSKAKVETKVQPSKLSQAYNSPTGKAIRTIGKVGIGVEGVKKITGF